MVPFHRVTLESRAAPWDVTPLNSICWYCANSICWEQIWIPMPATIYISDPATEQHGKGSSKASRVHSRGCRNFQSQAPTQNLAAGVWWTGKQRRGTATSDQSPRRTEGGKWTCQAQAAGEREVPWLPAPGCTSGCLCCWQSHRAPSPLQSTSQGRAKVVRTRSWESGTAQGTLIQLPKCAEKHLGFAL